MLGAQAATLQGRCCHVSRDSKVIGLLFDIYTGSEIKRLKSVRIPALSSSLPTTAPPSSIPPLTTLKPLSIPKSPSPPPPPPPPAMPSPKSYAVHSSLNIHVLAQRGRVPAGSASPALSEEERQRQLRREQRQQRREARERERAELDRIEIPAVLPPSLHTENSVPPVPGTPPRTATLTANTISRQPGSPLRTAVLSHSTAAPAPGTPPRTAVSSQATLSRQPGSPLRTATLSQNTIPPIPGSPPRTAVSAQNTIPPVPGTPPRTATLSQNTIPRQPGSPLRTAVSAQNTIPPVPGTPPRTAVSPQSGVSVTIPSLLPAEGSSDSRGEPSLRERREAQLQRLRAERERLLAAEEQRRRQAEQEQRIKEEMERIRQKAEAKRRAEEEKRRAQAEEEKRRVEEITRQRREVEQRQLKDRLELRREALRRRSASPPPEEENRGNANQPPDLPPTGETGETGETHQDREVDNPPAGSTVSPVSPKPAGSPTRSGLLSSFAGFFSARSPAKVETQKVEPQKVEPPKVEPKKVETQKVETQKVETPAKLQSLPQSPATPAAVFSPARSAVLRGLVSPQSPAVFRGKSGEPRDSVYGSLPIADASFNPFVSDSDEDSEGFPAVPSLESSKESLINPFGRESVVLRRLDAHSEASQDDFVPKPAGPVKFNPFDETPDASPRNPFDSEAKRPQTVVNLNPSKDELKPQKTAVKLNPFDEETPESSPRNPFDEEVKPTQPVKLNPFDDETPDTSPRNPFDAPAKTAVKLNPFDASTSDTSPRNPFDEDAKPAKPAVKLNPFDDETPDPEMDVPQISPISLRESFSQLASAAENREKPSEANPAGTQSAAPGANGTQLELAGANGTQSTANQNAAENASEEETVTDDPEYANERRDLRSMFEVYQSNRNGCAAARESLVEWNVFMMRFRAGIACKKWCSNNTSHQTVVRYVEENDRRFVAVKRSFECRSNMSTKRFW